MNPDAITVSIASISPRQKNGFFARAVASVGQQMRPAHAISVAVDVEHEGAPPTKQRALDGVTTPWVAFLDDDDELCSWHLEQLFGWARTHQADYVFGGFWIDTGTERLEDHSAFRPGHWTEPWDDANPRETTSTILCRTELAKEVGFERLPERGENNTGEDWRLVNGIMRLGGKIVCMPGKTWVWHWDSMNTSGLPTRW